MPSVLGAQHQHPSATSRRKPPQHVFPIAFSSLSYWLQTCATEQRFTESQSTSGALSFPHVSPQSNKKTISPPRKKNTQRPTNARSEELWRFLVSVSRLLFSFLSQFSRCVLVACYRKEAVLPPSSSSSLAVVIPLLLSSALPLNAEPGSHAACKYTQWCRSASIHFTEGRCARPRWVLWPRDSAILMLYSLKRWNQTRLLVTVLLLRLS